MDACGSDEELISKKLCSETHLTAQNHRTGSDYSMESDECHMEAEDVNWSARFREHHLQKVIPFRNVQIHPCFDCIAFVGANSISAALVASGGGREMQDGAGAGPAALCLRACRATAGLGRFFDHQRRRR